MTIIIASILAGVIGKGLGGVLVALLKNLTVRLTGIFMSFAGGVMVSIVLFELMPVAAQYSSFTTILVGISIGAVATMLINRLICLIMRLSSKSAKCSESPSNLSSKTQQSQPCKTMMRSGLALLFAIALHNFPEGLIIGVAGKHDISLSYTLAFIIGLHSIPEGMTISAPLIAGGMKKRKAAFLALLTGTSTILGAVVGIMAGSISDTAIAISLSVAGGAMLYAVFGEVLPQAIRIRKDMVTPFSFLIGLVAGFAISML